MVNRSAAVDVERAAKSRFGQHFEIVRATTPELLDHVFALRYQVYCVEKQFEDAAANPGERETDAYDQRACHSLLIYRPTGEVAGTVRLIPPRGEGDDPDFPIQTACGELKTWPPRLMPAAACGEISRFTVAARFRRRATDTLYGDAAASGQTGPVPDRRSYPYVTIGLLRAVYEMSLEAGLSHWCAIMDPALLRLLARLGVHFNPVGPLVDYHGWRQPCHAKRDDVIDQVRSRRREIWEAAYAE